jgi:hypothetical protein
MKVLTANSSHLTRVYSIALCLAGLVVLAGCASTKVTSQERQVYGNLPRPNRIVVYDFAATPAEIPSYSAFSGQFLSYPPTAEEAAIGRELGVDIATRVVEDIREMGLPAERGVHGAQLNVNDLVFHGYLVSIEQGNTAGRMAIGFGVGGSELTTTVEAFQMTPQGLKRLGSATLGSKSSKTPGAGLGAAGWAITGSPIGLIVGGGLKVYGEASGSSRVEGRARKTADEISDQLKERFKNQGWIN